MPTAVARTSRLRERCRESDSFSALALHSFNHSVLQSQIGLLSSTDSRHDCFSFLGRAWECVQHEMRENIEGDKNKASQPDRCMKTESRRGLERTEGLWEWWRAQRESGVFGRVSYCGHPSASSYVLHVALYKTTDMSTLSSLALKSNTCSPADSSLSLSLCVCACAQILRLEGGLESLSNRLVMEIQDIVNSHIERTWLPLFLSTAEFTERQKRRPQVTQNTVELHYSST